MLVSQNSAAGEVQHAGVHRSGDAYYLDLAASIDADLDTTYGGAGGTTRFVDRVYTSLKKAE